MKHKSILIYETILIFYLILLFLIFGSDQNYMTDESHFHSTILFFKNENFWEALYRYEEMSTPLPFIVYSIWAKIFNSDIITLRLFSVLIAFVFWNMVFVILDKNNTFHKYILLFGFMSNPYLIGLSIYVYTDMLALLFLLMSIWTMLQRKYLFSAITICLALLCRQYFVFILPAWLIYYYLNERKNPFPFMFFYSLIALFLLLFLFYFWGGSTPNNTIKQNYIDEAFYFHANAITAYIALLPVYLWFFIFNSKYRTFSKKEMYYGIALGIFLLLLFPIQTSDVAIHAPVSVNTIGLFDKIITKLFSEYRWIVWALLTIVGSIFLVKYILLNFDSSEPYSIYTITFICSFLVVMAFSYLTWEKYLLPLLLTMAIYPNFKTRHNH